MEDSRIWLYAAMMGIYFVAWLLKRIKRATSGEETDEEPEPSRTLAEVQENRKNHLERQAQRKAKADDPSEALRKLFESISGEVKKPDESFLPEEESAAPKPPPLKNSQKPPPLNTARPKIDPRSRLSSEEKKALADLKSQKADLAKPRKKQRAHSLRSMIRGSGLRQSVVLKEILDQPRAMKPF